MNTSRILIIAGIVLIVVGFLWRFVGKLPGDIQFKTGNVTVFIPITTMVLVSILLTIIFSFISRWK